MEGDGNEQRYQFMIRNSNRREKMGMKRREQFNMRRRGKREIEGNGNEQRHYFNMVWRGKRKKVGLKRESLSTHGKEIGET